MASCRTPAKPRLTFSTRRDEVMVYLQLFEDFLHRRNIIVLVDWIDLHNVLAGLNC